MAIGSAANFQILCTCSSIHLKNVIKFSSLISDALDMIVIRVIIGFEKPVVFFEIISINMLCTQFYFFPQ